MDIKFACENCGQCLVIDRAGAGVTIECPGCAKVVSVPTPMLLKPLVPPAQVDVKSATPTARPVSAPKASSPSSTNQPKRAATQVRFGGTTLR